MNEKKLTQSSTDRENSCPTYFPELAGAQVEKNQILGPSFPTGRAPCSVPRCIWGNWSPSLNRLVPQIGLSRCAYQCPSAATSRHI